MIDTVRFGSFSPSLPHLVAIEEGYFEQQGLAVEHVRIPSADALAAMMLESAIDVALIAPDNVLSLRFSERPELRELNLRILAAVDQGASVSLVGHRGVESVAALKGMRVAVDAVGSGFALLLYEILDRAGLSPGVDVDVVVAGGTPARFNQLIAGDVDGTILNAGFDHRAVAEGNAILARADQAVPAYLSTALVSPESTLKAQADSVGRFLAAWHRATTFIQTPSRSSECQGLLERELAVSSTVARAILDAATDPAGGIVSDGVVTDAHLRTLVELRSRWGAANAQLPSLADLDPRDLLYR